MAPRVVDRLYYVLPLTVVRRPTFIHQLARGFGFPQRVDYSVGFTSVQALGEPFGDANWPRRSNFARLIL